MADLTNLQGSTPVEIINETSGNSVAVNTDSSLQTAEFTESQIPKLFTATMSKAAVGATELTALFVKNPNASGKTLYLKTVSVTNTHTVAGSWIRWRMYSNPTTSANGSSVTARTLGIGSGNTAVATPFGTPTASAFGGLLADVTVIAGGTARYDFPVGSFILPNNTLLFTAVADGTSRVGQVTLVWSEL